MWVVTSRYRGTFRGALDVAVKTMRVDPDSPDSHGFSNAEVRAMQRIKGDRIVDFCAYIDLCFSPSLSACGFLLCSSFPHLLMWILP